MVLSELLPKHQITFTLMWIWWGKDLAKDPLKDMTMEGWEYRNLRIKGRRLWMNQSCCSLRFVSQNSLWKPSTFRGYKDIYSKVWERMWKVIFPAKQEALASHSQQGQVTSSNCQIIEWLECTFCSVMIQLYWPFNFLQALHVCMILASHHSQVNREFQSRESSSHENASWCTHLINSSHSLTHNPYIIPT